MRLRLESDPIGPRGGISGRGALKVMSGTKLNPLEVLVREAIQNSWDARSSGSVVFGLKAYRLSSHEKQFAMTALAEGIDARGGGLGPLITISSKNVDALVIFDRGTSGLDGPTNAGGTDTSNFERFFFGFGETKPQPGRLAAGGTFGFGRSSFLKCSAVNTILVHSRCRVKSALESRFMGMTFVDGYPKSGQRYSGRHWWGEVDSDNVFGPHLGILADTIASSLGMPLPKEPDETGTTILVLQPRWSLALTDSEEDVQEGTADPTDERSAAKEKLMDAMLWNAWPHMVDQSINLNIDWFGDRQILPDPKTHPRLKLFVRALEVSKQAHNALLTDNYSEIRCEKPIMALGSLGLSKAAYTEWPGQGKCSRIPSDAPLHHVALMRGAQLIVDYLDCRLPEEGQQYAGVFLVDSNVDEVFARSEPAAHDDWNVGQLEDARERTYVNVAIRRVRQSVNDFLSRGKDIQAGKSTGLGHIAEELGGVFPASSGDAVGGWNPTVGKGRFPPGKKPRARIEVYKVVRRIEGAYQILEVPFRIMEAKQATTIEASVSVITEGGEDHAQIEGTTSPEVIGWLIGKDATLKTGNRVQMPISEQDGKILVRQPFDCKVSLKINTI